MEILFENKNILVINKPSGLVVHSDGRTKEESVSSWLQDKYPEIKNVGEPWTSGSGEVIYRPGIVHRLDRDTSGVLVIAKNQESFLNLKTQFQDREIKKTYNAFVYGEMKEMEGVIDRPIGRSKSDFRKWSAQRGARGEMRDAVTEYKVLNKCKESSYVEVYPKTGRTHQIRVHFKAINHPVICDSLYAENKPPLLGLKRLALHARKIEISDINGDILTIEAPLPQDFISALDKIKDLC
jgi:23S rRNA pseudouridine1911/1915/1917 synthase